MPATATVAAVVPWLVAQAAARLGAEPGCVLAGTGIASDPIPGVEQRLSLDAYAGVWRAALAATKDEALPVHVAAGAHIEDSEVFGFLAISCRTLGEAYERTARYRDLYLEGAQWDLSTASGAVRLTWSAWKGEDEAGYRAAQAFAVADMAQSILRLGVDEPRPNRVLLRQPPPADAGPWADHFGVAPVFGAPVDELVYAHAVLDRPIASFNSRLRDYFDEACERLLSERQAHRASLAARVRRALVASMDGHPVTVTHLAKSLAMSPRSLQRRLAEEDTTFAALLDEVRESFARRYLERGTVSASEVSCLLGFADPPAFFKAFKRWTGLTPRAFAESRRG